MSSQIIENMQERKRLKQEIKDALSGTLEKGETVCVSEQTPEILLSAGMRQLPVLITQFHLKNCISEKNSELHQHGLGEEFFQEFPKLLKTPALLLDSEKHVDKEGRPDSVIAVLCKTDQDRCPVIAVVMPEGSGRYHGEEIDSNFLLTVYGQNNILKMIEIAKIEGRVLYTDHDRCRELSKLAELPGLEKSVSTLREGWIRESQNVHIKETEIIREEIEPAEPEAEKKEEKKVMGEAAVDAMNRAEHEIDEKRKEVENTVREKLKELLSKALNGKDKADDGAVLEQKQEKKQEKEQKTSKLSEIKEVLEDTKQAAKSFREIKKDVKSIPRSFKDFGDDLTDVPKSVLELGKDLFSIPSSIYEFGEDIGRVPEAFRELKDDIKKFVSRKEAGAETEKSMTEEKTKKAEVSEKTEALKKAETVRKDSKNRD